MNSGSQNDALEWSRLFRLVTDQTQMIEDEIRIIHTQMNIFREGNVDYGQISELLHICSNRIQEISPNLSRLKELAEKYTTMELRMRQARALEKQIITAAQTLQKFNQEVEQQMKHLSSLSQQVNDPLQQGECSLQLLQDNQELRLQLEEEAEMARLTNDIIALNEIFEKLGIIVHESGAKVDAIVEHVENIHVSIEKGEQQLTSAIKKKKSAKRKKCILILVISIVLLFVLLSVVIYIAL